jgi:hypothetical protein
LKSVVVRMATERGAASPMKHVESHVGSRMLGSLDSGSELASPKGIVLRTQMTSPTSEGELARAGSRLQSPLRRSTRRALMLTMNASAEENKSFIDQCKPCESEVNLAKGSALEAAGEEGSKLVGASVSRLQPDELPATPPSKRSGRTRKTSNSSEPVKEASVRAVKKSKILHDVAAPPVTSIVREEIGALSALPIPPSLLDEEVMRIAIDHLRTADAGRLSQLDVLKVLKLFFL